jgi:hypothetical protein
MPLPCSCRKCCTGTTFLTHLLALCPDTTSRHEPEPSFVPVLRLAQRDPELARRFDLLLHTGLALSGNEPVSLKPSFSR